MLVTHLSDCFLTVAPLGIEFGRDNFISVVELSFKVSKGLPEFDIVVEGKDSTANLYVIRLKGSRVDGVKYSFLDYVRRD
jgi:hypothetical protein